MKNVAREARVGEVGAHNLQNLNLGVGLRLSIHIALCPIVENTQLTLNLQTENKGGVVSVV